jgi:Trypsin
MNQLICPAPYNFKLENYKQNYFSSGDLPLKHYLAQSSVLDLSNSNAITTNKLDSKNKNYIYIKSKIVETTNCLDLVSRKSNVTGIDDGIQICAGNDPFAVPEFCKSIIGGALLMEGLYRRSDLATNRIPYLVGVQSHGDDCGFGLPNVYSRVASVIPWIDSVIYSDENGAKKIETNLEIAEEYSSKYMCT